MVDLKKPNTDIQQPTNHPKTSAELAKCISLCIAWETKITRAKCGKWVFAVSLIACPVIAALSWLVYIATENPVTSGHAGYVALYALIAWVLCAIIYMLLPMPSKYAPSLIVFASQLDDGLPNSDFHKMSDHYAEVGYDAMEWAMFGKDC